MNASEHFKAGQLAEAITAATAVVKANPGEGSSRFLLCELLCFAGEFERADKQLDAISEIDPKSLPVISLFRQLLRAEQARLQFYTDGRVPEFLTLPSEQSQLRLQASILIREKDLAGAAKLLEQAEEARTQVSGECDGQPFDDIRDLDDLTASFLEVLTSTGKYYWIPFDTIDSMEFPPIERPRDLLWRQVHMIVRGGPDGVVYIPTLYTGSTTDPDPLLRLGRATDWRGGDASPVRGIGQRMLLVGDSEKSILGIQNIQFQSLPEA